MLPQGPPDPEAGITQAGQQMARQLSRLEAAEEEQVELYLETSCVLSHTQNPTHHQTTTPVHHSSPTHHAASSPAHPTASSPTHLLDSSPASPSSPDHVDFMRSISQFRRSFRDRNVDSAHVGGAQLSKKPSVLSVLFGSQYSNSISQGEVRSTEKERAQTCSRGLCFQKCP